MCSTNCFANWVQTLFTILVSVSRPKAAQSIEPRCSTCKKKTGFSIPCNTWIILEPTCHVQLTYVTRGATMCNLVQETTPALLRNASQEILITALTAPKKGSSRNQSQLLSAVSTSPCQNFKALRLCESNLKQRWHGPWGKNCMIVFSQQTPI